MSYVCGHCKKTIHANANAIRCNSYCKSWFHANCAGLDKTTLQNYMKEQKKPDGNKWSCKDCEDTDDQSDLNLTLGSQLNEGQKDDEARIENIFVKHFSTFKKDLVQTLEACMANVADLQSRMVLLEEENKNLKESLQKIQADDNKKVKPHDELTTIEKTVKEIEERNKRKCNLVIFGISENKTTPEASQLHDETQVKRVLNFLIPNYQSPDLNLRRLGKYDHNKITPRPIKISLNNEGTVLDAIKKAKDLTKSGDFSGINISFDKTPMQQELYRAVRDELKKRTIDGEVGLKIRYKSGLPTIVQEN